MNNIYSILCLINSLSWLLLQLLQSIPLHFEQEDIGWLILSDKSILQIEHLNSLLIDWVLFVPRKITFEDIWLCWGYFEKWI